MSGDKDGLLYWPKYFLDHSSTSFASLLGLLNRGSLRAQSWFSLRHTFSNWLQLPGDLVILFSNVHLLPLFFRLFTQVHLLIDGSVDGQYITPSRTYERGILFYLSWFTSLMIYKLFWSICNWLVIIRITFLMFHYFLGVCSNFLTCYLEPNLAQYVWVYSYKIQKKKTNKWLLTFWIRRDWREVTYVVSHCPLPV